MQTERADQHCFMFGHLFARPSNLCCFNIEIPLFLLHLYFDTPSQPEVSQLVPVRVDLLRVCEGTHR